METLSSRAKSFIVGSIRKSWRFYSDARKQCLKSKRCVSCKSGNGKLYADHIIPVGRFIPECNPYIVKMFCEASNLQTLCATCHDAKTALERKAMAKERAASKKGAKNK